MKREDEKRVLVHYYNNTLLDIEVLEAQILAIGALACCWAELDVYKTMGFATMTPEQRNMVLRTVAQTGREVGVNNLPSFKGDLAVETDKQCLQALGRLHGQGVNIDEYVKRYGQLYAEVLDEVRQKVNKT